MTASLHLASSTRRRSAPLRHALQLLVACVLALGLVPAAFGAVPNDRAVPAYAEEQTILQLEQNLPEPGLGSAASGREHLDRHGLVEPGRIGEYNVILQRGGNTWRVLRNGPLAVITAVLLLGVTAAILVFHGVVGPAEAPVGTGGQERQLLRFTRWQRIVHWSAAIAFVVLALTGLLLLFGKQVLLPWMGHDVFAWLSLASKYLHNVAGPLFVLFSLVMFFTYLRHNHFVRSDWTWLRRAGGMFTHRHVPADYFNAGEKLWFWIGVTGLGVWMAATGLMLNFPYFGEVGAVRGFTRYQLQWANVLHIVGAALYTAAGLGHIYLGTLGSPGAWHAMWHGKASAPWARAHHQIWYDDVQRAGGDPARTSAVPPLGPAPRT